MGLPGVWNTKQYEANLRHLLQQQGSRLINTVTRSSGGFNGGEYKFIDFIADGEMVEITNRLGNTEWQDPDASRRRIAKRSYEFARIFDKFEKLNRLNDPTSAEMMNAVYAVGRQNDRTIIDALGGTAYTGKEGATATTFDANQIVDSSGTDGLTLNKLKSTLLLFNQNEVSPDLEKYFAVHAQQIDDMLGITQITNTDYNSIKVLVEGKVASFMGFRFVMCNLLATDSNSDRECFAYVKNGIEYCIDTDMVTTVDRLPERRNAIGLQTQMTGGAVRTEEKRVVKILCDE